MKDQSIHRRKLLTSGLTAGLVGGAGCLGKQEPDATHWAAGIRWADPPRQVIWENGFSPTGGDMFTGPANEAYYLRVNGGELQRSGHSDKSVPAGRGDHVEFVIDFDRPRQGRETVFEYIIPDDEDLVGVLAGFTECLHYRGTDKWVVRPLNVDVSTDFLGRQKETLLVKVYREREDDNPDWYVWGHDESVREALRDRAAESDAEIDIEFMDLDAEATFSPSSYRWVEMEVADGADRVAQVSFPEPDADP